jgi:hypothetical protein
MGIHRRLAAAPLMGATMLIRSAFAFVTAVVVALLGAVSVAHATPPTTAAQTAPADAPNSARAEFIKRMIEARRMEMRRNANGEIRKLDRVLFDGYRLEFEHNLTFEDVHSDAAFREGRYELALRVVQPQVALAELMQRLLDASFTVEEPVGPPEGRMLRFWRQGRTINDARIVIQIGERAMPKQPSPVEVGATGILAISIRERIAP